MNLIWKRNTVKLNVAIKAKNILSTERSLQLSVAVWLVTINLLLVNIKDIVDFGKKQYSFNVRL